MLVLPPIGSIVLFTAGLLLIAGELNRPGLVLPGCAGLCCTLLGLASVARLQDPAAILGCLLGALAVSALDLMRHRFATAVVAAVLYLAGFLLLADRGCGAAVRLIAAVCGLTVGGLFAWLAKIAHRARRNKGRAARRDDLD
jgi:membrane-bound ClpP family serine protease